MAAKAAIDLFMQWSAHITSEKTLGENTLHIVYLLLHCTIEKQVLSTILVLFFIQRKIYVLFTLRILGRIRKG